jgi:hypothetical protein
MKKCKHCGFEWKDGSGGSQFTECPNPNCRKSLIETQEKPKFYDNRKEALAAIAEQFGVEMLLGKLNAILPDIARIPKDDKELAYLVYEKGAAQVLKEHINGSQADKQRAAKIAIGKLPSWIAKEGAEMIIGEFTAALGWNQVIKSAISYDTAPTSPVVDRVGDIIKFSGYDWRILEIDVANKRKLVLSEKVLEQRVYNEKYVSVTWETCDLRNYLNGEFLNKLDGKKIVPINNHNPNNPWYDTAGGNNTNDSMFLLNIDEVVKYFGGSGDLKSRKGWYLGDDSKLVLKDGQGWAINDQYNDLRIVYDMNGKTCWWWLRSPGGNNGYAAGVVGGSIAIGGCGVLNNSGGVRPALWLNL